MSRLYILILSGWLMIMLSAHYANAVDGNNTLGALKKHSFQNGVFTGTTSNGQFRVTVYSPTVLRIQITKTATFGDFSYAVVALPQKSKNELREEQTRFILKTDSLDLIVTKNPVRFTMLNKRSEVINEDDSAFGTSWLGEETTTYKKLQDGERFIGLGEKTGNLDRRGQAYTNWNTDYFGYPSTADAIYLTTPFYIGVHHRLVYGVFMDNSSRSNFNFGASNNRFSSFTAQEGEMNYYLIHHTTVTGIIESYTWLTGRMTMPPLWSLGLQQSRYSYYPASEVLNIAKTFREKSIPGDVIYLDIHYMDKFKIFTWDKERFPDPKKLTTDLNAIGFHLAVILDPGIKVEKNYQAYDQGVKEDVFVKYPDNTYYTAEVWPGWCHFPDFTKAGVRSWWAHQFKDYVRDGVEGFWNDMNEPASWGQSTPNLIDFDFDGHKATHRSARNVYGLNMTRSTFEGTKKLLNGKRPFLLTRSGYSGIQRYSAVWTGDNVASDEHMMLGVRLMTSMGLTGIPVTGMDVGGFTGNGSDKLFARWVSIGAFSPFFRIHANANTRAQEPWSFGEYVEGVIKNYVNLRYQLIPYLYSTFHESAENGIPIARSLALNYPFESRVYDQRYQQQFLFGGSIMVAPGESTKDFYKVFLPQGEWFDFYSDKKYAGDQEIIAEAAFDHLPLFVKGSSIIPMQSIVQHLDQLPEDILDLHVYKGDVQHSFVFYEDDGTTYDYQKGIYHQRKISFDPSARNLIINKAEGTATSRFKKARIIMHGFNKTEIAQLTINGVPVRSEDTQLTMFPSSPTVHVITTTLELSNENIVVTWK